jgi:hypothetical protein
MQNSTNLKILSATAAVLLAATVVLQPVMAGSSVAPQAQATATPKPKATATPAAKTAATPATKATPDAGIVVQPISNDKTIKSYRTNINMNLDGVSAGKVSKGDLNADVQSIPGKKQQSAAISGSQMGQLLSPFLGGLPVNKLTMYLMDKNVYVLAQSLLTVCATPKNPIAGIDQLKNGLSADQLITGLTGSNKIYGKLVGEETVNGIPSKHYKLDVKKMNELAKKNKVDLSLNSGDVWLAKNGGYVTRFNGDMNGALNQTAGVDFKGNVKMQMNLGDLNKINDIPLPNQCSRPIQI